MSLYLPKSEIYNSLRSINNNYYVAQTQPPTFTTTPAIIFRVGDNVVNTDLDNSITSQEIEIIVDIWADTSVVASDVLLEVENKLRNIKYRMTYSTDVPNTSNLYHINCRFSAIC